MCIRVLSIQLTHRQLHGTKLDFVLPITIQKKWAIDNEKCIGWVTSCDLADSTIFFRLAHFLFDGGCHTTIISMAHSWFDKRSVESISGVIHTLLKGFSMKL